MDESKQLAEGLIKNIDRGLYDENANILWTCINLFRDKGLLEDEDVHRVRQAMTVRENEPHET